MGVPPLREVSETMIEPPSADPLEDLFVAHYSGLVRLVSGLLDDNETCEEVVQDVFATMVQSSRQPVPGKEAAYLRAACLNRARSAMRKRRVRRRHLAAVPEPSRAAEVTALEHIENERVLATIRDLPKRQADVLLLRYQGGLSEREIADTLGISTGSVKTHASRGLATMRKKLEEIT